jgi:CBS domain-containing protein
LADELLKKPISDLNIITKNVESISEDMSVLDALRIMRDKRLRGVPVVDANFGNIIASLSASDFLVLIAT